MAVVLVIGRAVYLDRYPLGPVLKKKREFLLLNVQRSYSIGFPPSWAIITFSNI
jgi:hypothetical protein